MKTGILQKLRKFTDVGYFIGASFAGAALGFLLLPLFTHYLLKEDFAIVGFSMAFNTFVSPIFSLSLIEYYIKAYNGQLETEQGKSALVSTLLICSLIWAITIFIIFSIVGPFAFPMFGIRIPFYPYINLLLLTNIVQIPISLCLMEFRLQRLVKQYFLLSLIISLCTILIPFGFVIYIDRSAVGRLAGFAAANVLIAGYTIFKLWPLLRFSNISKELFRKAIKFSAPLIPYTLCYLSFDFIDKFLVQRFNGDLKILGYYNVAFQFANILFVFGNALYRAYEPVFYKLHYEGNNSRLCKLYDYIGYVILASGIMLILLLPFIIHLLTSKDYSLSVSMGKWLILTSMVQAIGIVYQTQFSLTGKTMRLMLIAMIVVALYCIIGYFLSGIYGYLGTIYAKLIMQIIFVSVSYIIFFDQLKKSIVIYVTMLLVLAIFILFTLSM
jgi:O-antigen/teichoic acid export membrane protein